MYSFEREALGIESMGEIRGGVTVTGQVETSRDPLVAWWLTSLYAPDIWNAWRVGLVREVVSIAASSPITLSSPMEFELPKDGEGRLDIPEAVPRRLIVFPALMKERALGFVVRNPDAVAGDQLANPSPHLQLVAPTNLTARLGLKAGDTIGVRVLPAHTFAPEQRPHR